MQAIIERLSQDHGNVARLLDLLGRQCRLLRDGSDFDGALTTRILRYMTKYQDVFHHPKEDLLFARVRYRSPGSSQLLSSLEDEHQELRKLGTAIHRRLSDGARNDERADLERSLSGYVELLRGHMEVESVQVFPQARVILSIDDWGEIESQLETEPDPIFHGDVEEGYRAVIEALGRA